MALERYKGIVIALEGVEGCGKSTQSRYVTQKLRDSGYEVVNTREPGGTLFGDKTRALLIEERDACEQARLMMFLASRAQLVHEVIIPALKRGAIVICDRFIDSSIALQGGVGGMGYDLVYQLCMAATRGIIPDATLYLEIPIEESRRRLQGRPAEDFDTGDETIEFLKKQHTAYMQWKVRAPYRFFVYDGLDDTDSLTKTLTTTIESVYTAKSNLTAKT
jgi:dTMP kinase